MQSTHESNDEILKAETKMFNIFFQSSKCKSLTRKSVKYFQKRKLSGYQKIQRVKNDQRRWSFLFRFIDFIIKAS